MIGEQSWAEMTVLQKAEAVSSGRATLKQLAEGLLDGSDELRNACKEFMKRTDAALEDISLELAIQKKPLVAPDPRLKKILKKRNTRNPTPRVVGLRKTKQRFGLPDDFTPRLQQYGRSVLLKDNIYRLPSGQEFIPEHPTGTLGKPRHLYALLTAEQFARARRGSVYVRTDGRIFDYSVDHADPKREMFDTGFTINDLERTGRYAPQPQTKKRQPIDAEPRGLAQAG